MISEQLQVYTFFTYALQIHVRMYYYDERTHGPLMKTWEDLEQSIHLHYHELGV